MTRELTDLEGDLGSGPVARPVMIAAMNGLSEESRNVLEQRYKDGTRVMLAGEMSDKCGWSAQDTNGYIRDALAELNENIRRLIDRG